MSYGLQFCVVVRRYINSQVQILVVVIRVIIQYIHSSPAFEASMEVEIISSQDGELVGLRDVWVTDPFWLVSDFFFLNGQTLL